jgi:hypothetical protein
MGAMLLYERLIGPNHPRDPSLASMREDFAAAVLVVVDNVARFYSDSPQEDWHLARHFPNIAPPWPKVFYEYQVPRFMNVRGKIQPNRAADSRIGVLLHASSIEEVLSERRAKRGDRPLSSHERDELTGLLGPYASSLVWGTADQEAYEQADVGWLCYGMVILEAPHREPRLLNTVYFAVSRQGEIVARPDGEAELLVNVPDDGNPEHLELRRSGASAYLHVPLLATCFLHCNNVHVADVVPPAKLARAQERRYGVPKVTFKVLDIQPMRRVLDEHGGMARGHTAQQALHIVRGHFKHFDDHPLFGKHRGMFWWPMSVRGNSDAGITAKSYEVSPADDVATRPS